MLSNWMTVIVHFTVLLNLQLWRISLLGLNIDFLLLLISILDLILEA